MTIPDPVASISASLKVQYPDLCAFWCEHYKHKDSCKRKINKPEPNQPSLDLAFIWQEMREYRNKVNRTPRRHGNAMGQMTPFLQQISDVVKRKRGPWRLRTYETYQPNAMWLPLMDPRSNQSPAKRHFKTLWRNLDMDCVLNYIKKLGFFIL